MATNLYAEHNFGMGNLMVFALRVRRISTSPGSSTKSRNCIANWWPCPTPRSQFHRYSGAENQFMGADENGLVFKRLIPTAGISTDNPSWPKSNWRFSKEGIKSNRSWGRCWSSMEVPTASCAYRDYSKGRVRRQSGVYRGDYDDGVKEIYLPGSDRCGHDG